MAARIAKADVQPPDRERIEARYAEEGLRPYALGNPGTEHAATVGDDGVLCLEAAA